MAYSTYLETLINKLAFGRTGSPWTPPATLYIGLSSTTPAADGTGVTEPAVGAYARVAVANDGTGWVAAGAQPGAGQAQANAGVVTFPKATANWGVMTDFVIYDAAVGGNFWGTGKLQENGANQSQTINTGDTLSFSAGTLVVTMS